ncbi:MAG: hypothetical protein ACRDN0_21740 [Trebonia sp.]
MAGGRARPAPVANAAYALGTVLAVQLAQYLPQRRMLLVYGTSLIAASPPLFLGFPAEKLRWTTVIFNLCIFGAVAAGPLIGGAQASFHAWRPLFWIMVGIAVAA